MDNTTGNVYEGEEKEDLRQDCRSSGREDMIVLICDWRVWTVWADTEGYCRVALDYRDKGGDGKNEGEEMSE